MAEHAEKWLRTRVTFGMQTINGRSKKGSSLEGILIANSDKLNTDLLCTFPMNICILHDYSPKVSVKLSKILCVYYFNAGFKERRENERIW